MKYSFNKITVVSVIAVAIALAPTQLSAQEKAPDKPAEKQAPAAAERSDRPIPFRGKIGAVDQTAQTVTVGERKFHVTDQTRIVKSGKPAKLSEAAVGEEVGGTYKKDGDKLVAQMIRLGAKPEASETPAAEKKAK